MAKAVGVAVLFIAVGVLGWFLGDVFDQLKWWLDGGW